MCIDVSLLVSVKVLEDTSLGSALADSAEAAAAIRGSDRWRWSPRPWLALSAPSTIIKQFRP